MRQGKADVLDGQATLQPLHLIVGLDVQDVIGQAAGIQVIGIGLDGQVVLLDEGVGIGIEKGAIGLQVNDAAVAQDIAVIVQEARRCQALVDFLHLRVGEGNPYLGHLVGGKHAVNQLDAGAQEGHIRQAEFGSQFGSGPHAGTLDVHADVILAREALSESHGIFPLAAA